MEVSNKPKKYRIGRIAGFASLRSEFHRFAAFVGAHLGIKVESDDIKRAEATTDGIRLKIGSGNGTGAVVLPLNVNADGTVVPGTIGGAMPKIGADRLDASPPPALTIPGSGTRYVIATITGQMTARTLAGQVYTHATLADLNVAISLTSSAPAPADLQATFPGAGTLSTFKLHLATFVNGAKTAQNGYGPITYELKDSLAGSGLTTLSPTWTSIVA